MDNIPQNTPLKQCSKCKRSLPATNDFFGKDKNRKDGLCPTCKECRKASKNLYTYDESLSGSSTRICTGCGNSYPSTPEFFSRNKRKKDGLQSQCKACAAVYSHRWQASHKEQKREMDKQYYMKNGENIRTRSKIYRNTHSEHDYEVHKRYRKNHSALFVQYNAKYTRTDKGKMMARAAKQRRRAREIAADGTHTGQQLQEQIRRQKYACYYCKKKLGDKWHADHVIPLSKGGSNDISNIVIACPDCNFRKSDKYPWEWTEGGRLF